jgi:flagellar basal-body rod protein FlgB
MGMIFGMNNAFAKKMELYEMALDAVCLRREVIADNIANADTPFFKRSEVTFESQLRRAIESEKIPEFPTLMTDKRHIDFNQFIDYRTVKPKIVVEFDTTYRNDKNNVDIDKESVDAMKNSMQYNALIEGYSRNIRIIDTVMR